METGHRLKGTLKYNQFCTSLTNALHEQICSGTKY